MLHAQGVQAADQLQDVHTHLRELQQQERQIRQQLSDKSSQTVSEIARSGIPDSDTAQRPLPDLLQEATVLDTGAKYLDRLEAGLVQLPDSCAPMTLHQTASMLQLHSHK